MEFKVRDKFKKMNTRQLLAEYRRTRQSHDSFQDIYDEVDIKELKQALKEMRSELKTREHIPNKIEAKKLRQQKAKKKK